MARIYRDKRAWQSAGVKAARDAGLHTSEHGAYLRRVKGSKRANATIRASGRVPGQEARAKWQAMTPDERKRKRDGTIKVQDSGHANLDGI
jgi:hypothetical protein